MAFTHGVYTQELDTKVYAVREVDSALPFVVGVAPVHNLPSGTPQPINEPKLIFNFTEFVKTFGAPKDAEDPSVFGLYEFARVYFTLYGMSPAVFVNVFDPANHTDASGNPDPTAVTAADVIGGVDATNGTRTGLELIEEVFPRFGKIVGLVLAPGFSHNTTVANALIAKAESINQNFKAMAYIDVPDTAKTPTDAVAFKQNFGSSHAVFFWPRAMEGDRAVPLSIHAAGLTAKVDRGNGGVPYESPSNKELRVTGPEKILTLQEANYLNEQGLVTMHRMMTGWKLWGNRTAAFPGVTDIKDSFIPCRRMANWIENNLIVNTWQKVDDPMNKRLIESVVDTTNIWLNGLAGRGMLLGARVAFLPEENPETDLANGIIRFHIYYLAPPPAETIEFVLEVDLDYFKTLFGNA
ncbi:MAG TPA: phage tail sheath protein [Thermosulfurimonas dismutans]|uniref:Phage tail sheath protein n=1 Tax=Thermosulfurimonas dismutans TaxID=999894 RepID=A0A7C3GRX3_9BACT|nr:phage tail sheath protein [Thermosulfurimonas dismutans]